MTFITFDKLCSIQSSFPLLTKRNIDVNWPPPSHWPIVLSKQIIQLQLLGHYANGFSSRAVEGRISIYKQIG